MTCPHDQLNRINKHAPEYECSLCHEQLVLERTQTTKEGYGYTKYDDIKKGMHVHEIPYRSPMGHASTNLTDAELHFLYGMYHGEYAIRELPLPERGQ